MKILYISYDGAREPIPQSQVLPYLKGLTKNGMSFCWFSFEKKTASPSDEKFKTARFRKELLKNNIKWYSLPYHKRPSLLAKCIDITAGIFYAFYIVLVNRVKIVHGRGEIASVICMALQKIFGLKFIYDRRGYMAEDYIEGGMWKSRKSLNYILAKFADKRMLFSANAIVVLTNKIKGILQHEYPGIKNNFYVIPCCADLKKFKYEPMACSARREILTELKLENKFIFIYIGSLGTWYMLDEMMDFFRHSKARIPNAHFLILSMSDHGIVRDTIIRKNQKMEDFTILNIAPSMVQDYVCLAHTALMFIKPTFSKLSSLPTKFAESLACGLPVVINSNIGDCDDLIESHDIGAIVKRFDEAEYKNSMEKLMMLLKDREHLRQRCRSVAEEHLSLEKGTGGYRGVYLKLTA